MKKTKKLTVILTMILCIFSVISFQSVKASAATVGFAHKAYFMNYSNNAQEAYATIYYTDSSKEWDEKVWTNTSTLAMRGANKMTIRMLQASINTVRYCNSTLGSQIPFLTVDGLWGPATDSAVRKYQAYKNSLSVDGICGARTWRALINDVIKADNGQTITRN